MSVHYACLVTIERATGDTMLVLTVIANAIANYTIKK